MAIKADMTWVFLHTNCHTVHIEDSMAYSFLSLFVNFAQMGIGPTECHPGLLYPPILQGPLHCVL